MRNQTGDLGKSTPVSEYTTAAELWERFGAPPRSVTTGCPSIDRVLSEAQGLLRGEVTELIGPSASGKTQLCLNCIRAAVKQAGSSVVVLDTSASITASRIADCLAAQELLKEDTAACLGRVECHRVFNLFDALNTVSALAVRREGSSVSGTMNAMLENLSSLCAWLIFVPSPCPAQDVLMDELKLIVVDSVYDIAAPILGDREAEGQALLSHFSQSLQHLARLCHAAVLVTNITDPAVAGQRSITPALGKMWAQTAHTRLLLGRSSSSSSMLNGEQHQQRGFTVELVKSRTTMLHKGAFTISDIGLQ